eukprot:TRINITY_DN20333_c0_g1_i1.p1 TRINITY_DN20333_c0_g1~~TRINITY_DN20333_c0_g1_i1.p1  ORF type:complete len:343 (+),score=80.98 TRINITY_DN20333_c0_g1_i1:47-1030(+)
MKLPSRMKAIMAEGGKCVAKAIPLPPVSGEEVLVKVKATAVNRADTLQRKGMYAVPKGATPVLGLEMSGTVLTNSDKWKEGDEVMGLLSGGGYAEYCSVDQGLLMPVPKGYSLEEAAAIPETWLTAYQLLHFVGNLSQNEVVVIHAAGSGVGTAAIQLASKVEDVIVIATAGTDQKLQVATELGATHAFNYKQCSWNEELKKVIPHGTNLILDPVGGSYAAKNCDALAVDGRWVLYALMGGAKIGDFPILPKLLSKRAALIPSTLRTRSLSYRKKLVSEFATRYLDNFSSDFKLVFDQKSFDLEDIQLAHDYMETNANIGKILIKIS